MVHQGGCLCGAVRFACEGEPVNVRCCHCRQCQQTFSSPFFARAYFAAGQVSLTGKTIGWPTSERLERLSCPACGGRVASRRRDGSGFGLPLAAFDDPDAFVPTDHIWTSETPAWLKLDDGLPRYPQGVPA